MSLPSLRLKPLFSFSFSSKLPRVTIRSICSIRTMSVCMMAGFASYTNPMLLLLLLLLLSSWNDINSLTTIWFK